MKCDFKHNPPGLFCNVINEDYKPKVPRFFLNNQSTIKIPKQDFNNIKDCKIQQLHSNKYSLKTIQ